jgi:hypothetical protein
LVALDKRSESGLVARTRPVHEFGVIDLGIVGSHQEKT